MMPLQAFILALLLVTGLAHAQSPGEIAFWESVRDSRNLAELRAYLQQYPNGTFKAIAEARIAALEKPVSAPQPQPAPKPKAASTPVAAGAPHKLQVGDKWTYRLSYPRLRGQWGQADRAPATEVITLTSAALGRIVDELSVDGGTSLSITHEPTPTLLPQGAAVFSPYPFALDKMQGGRWFRSVINAEPECIRRFTCDAKARIAGSEPVTVSAGTFLASKVIVEQEWWASAGGAGARTTGGRTVTIWYAPEIGRAVKFSSRMTVGDVMPVDPNFDLELISYQLK